MTENDHTASRRAFMKGGLALGGAAVAATAARADDPAITELQPWTVQLGDDIVQGADDRAGIIAYLRQFTE